MNSSSLVRDLPDTPLPSTRRAPNSNRSQFEGTQFGGALMTTTEVENFPGFREGIMGPDLMEEMREQAKRFGADIRTEDVEELDLTGADQEGRRRRRDLPGARGRAGNGRRSPLPRHPG